MNFEPSAHICLLSTAYCKQLKCKLPRSIIKCGSGIVVTHSHSIGIWVNYLFEWTLRYRNCVARSAHNINFVSLINCNKHLDVVSWNFYISQRQVFSLLLVSVCLMLLQELLRNVVFNINNYLLYV